MLGARRHEQQQTLWPVNEGASAVRSITKRRMKRRCICRRASRQTGLSRYPPLNSIAQAYILSTAAISSRHQDTGIGLPAAPACCIQSEPFGAADWTSSLYLSTLPPAAQAGHDSQHESITMRRSVVDWVLTIAVAGRPRPA